MSGIFENRSRAGSVKISVMFLNNSCITLHILGAIDISLILILSYLLSERGFTHENISL
jgi:hypothetical protein